MSLDKTAVFRRVNRIGSSPGLAYLLLALPLAPNVVWAVRDRGLWPSDACSFGVAGLELAHTLLHDTSHWWARMLETDIIHPPMVSWLAQLFVPIGHALGHVEAGLLLLPVVLHYGALVLLYRMLVTLLDRRVFALLGCLVLASAPAFIGVGKQLVSQPLQMLVVVWFLSIMVHASQRDGMSTLLHLVAASSLALLTMLSTPGFCVVTGLAALVEVYRKGRSGLALHRGHAPLVALCVSLVGPGTVWYAVNGSTALWYARVSYSTPWVAWVDDEFLLKLGVWVEFLRDGAFFFPAALAVAAGVTVWAAVSRARQPGGGRRRPTLLVGLAAVQLVLALVMHAGSSQQLYRYVLPFTPFVALVIAWGAAQLNRAWVTGALAVTFAAQLVLVNARDHGLTTPTRTYGVPMLEVEVPRIVELMDGILGLPAGDPPRTVVVELRAYSLDGSHLALRVARHKQYLEDHLSGGGTLYYTADVLVTLPPASGDLDVAWQELLEIGPRYFVTADAETRRNFAATIAAERATSSIAERLSLELAERVASSEQFRLVVAPAYPELEIYEYRATASSRRRPDSLSRLAVRLRDR